jgi:alcohol dehydrogenase (cytochrome c)
VSTIGLPPNGRGILFALDANTGSIRWRLSTIKNNWNVPTEAGGGGAWETPSVADGNVFWGTSNPYPYGGSRAHPNGEAHAGADLYTDSLLVIDARTGKLVWHDQVTPHDVRDYDFQLPPVIGSVDGRPVVFGGGKAGLVIAWDRSTHRRLWQTAVGIHRNDRGRLPRHPVAVCPGLLGGVETPMASADGHLYVPVVDLCMRGSAIGYEPLDRVNVFRRGRGELVALDAATGGKVWTLHLPQPDFGCATAANGVVFTATLDGKVYGVDAGDGHVLWSASLRAGVNACPALASHTLLVGAGVPKGRGYRLELTAFTTGSAA